MNATPAMPERPPRRSGLVGPTILIGLGILFLLNNLRLVDCIECGLCVSACPIMATAISYIGPAALAAAEHSGLAGEPDRMAFVDHQDGVWRCHNTFECSAVCPSAVDPAARIMQLRKQIVGQRMKRLMRGGKEPQP
jgi:Fe-S oxidoreductase